MPTPGQIVSPQLLRTRISVEPLPPPPDSSASSEEEVEEDREEDVEEGESSSSSSDDEGEADAEGDEPPDVGVVSWRGMMPWN